MKLRPPHLAIAAIIGSIAAGSDTDGTNSDPSPTSSSTGGYEVIQTPTYAQTMEDAIRELMQDFSHMTSLHESLVHHPLFSRHNIGNKPFSTWGSFGSLSRWSPRYEVIDDPKTFQVKLDVPGFHFHEMNVELESGGRVLSISGTKEVKVHEQSGENGEEEKTTVGEDHGDHEGKNKFEFSSHTSTSFQQKFTLDPSIDTSLMTANLVNGVLEVRAPRKQGLWNRKHIPITQFDQEVWEELLATDEDGDAKSQRL